MEQLIRNMVENVAERIAHEREYLDELDSRIGDGDFGTNLHRGSQAALRAVDDADDTTPSELVSTVGQTLLEEVGGSSGVLLGMSLQAASSELEAHDTGDGVVTFAETYRSEIEDRGDVSIGEKTMFDVVVPVVDVLRASTRTDSSPAEVSGRALEAARRGVMYTSELEAQRGRASYTELRSVGRPDPGAVGTYIILEEIHETIQSRTGERVSPSLSDGFDPDTK